MVRFLAPQILVRNQEWLELGWLHSVRKVSLQTREALVHSQRLGLGHPWIMSFQAPQTAVQSPLEPAPGQQLL